MKKIKATLFILTGTLIHFGLMYKLILNSLACDMQPSCVSHASQMGMAILGFPLNLIRWILFPNEIKPPDGLFVLLLLNSLLVITLIWFLLIRPFVRRAHKNAAR